MVEGEITLRPRLRPASLVHHNEHEGHDDHDGSAAVPALRVPQARNQEGMASPCGLRRRRRPRRVLCESFVPVVMNHAAPDPIPGAGS